MHAVTYIQKGCETTAECRLPHIQKKDRRRVQAVLHHKGTAAECRLSLIYRKGVRPPPSACCHTSRRRTAAERMLFYITK